ncbi:rhomboid family intramembrane serine protease [Planctomycetota bacterium]
MSQKKYCFLHKCPLGYLFILMAITMAYSAQVQTGFNTLGVQRWILRGPSYTGVFGYMWLHLGLIHLLESLVLLWFFGRKAARELGPILFITVYLGCGLVAALLHLAFDGRPTVGASGAVMGILGLHATLYYRDFGRIGPLLLSIWVGLTLGFGIAHAGPAAHWAHFGGFLTGVGLASVLLVFRRADAHRVHPDWARWLRVSTDAANKALVKASL